MVLAAAALPAAAQGYGAQPLRHNLGAEPYFRTEGGRVSHRFAAAEVNRYRLYDFYRRQADFYRANPAMNDPLLPPFPGLDGGRRGHWGVTNEKDVGALRRAEAPDWPSATMRGGQGLLFVSNGGWMVFDTLRGGLFEEYTDARPCVPEHPFGFEVDRFGMRIELSGAPRFRSDRAEWRIDGEASAWFAGYHVFGDETILRWELGNGTLLDRPSQITGQDGIKLLSRSFELLDGAVGELNFQFPQPWAGEAAVVISNDRTSLMIREDLADRSTLHRILYDEDVVVEWMSGSHDLRCGRLKKGSQIRILSWTGDSRKAATAGLCLASYGAEPRSLSELILGGPSRYLPKVRVQGVPNADSSASGTAYEIDDIPIPFDQLGRAPMTLSGLAFDTKGVAYACTLVGDVWKISGLHGDLSQVQWKKFASGLDMPMGVEVLGDVPYISARRYLFRLLDLNGDEEADHYQRFNRMLLPDPSESGRDLRSDGFGRLVFNAPSGIYRLSADGTKLETIGAVARNPLGLGVRQDGLVVSDSSEGNLENGTCTLYESDHDENERTVAKRKRLLYLPRGVDNSPGSRLFMEEPRFGPLGKTMIGVSYGSGVWYSILRDVVDGTPQAALVPQVGQFSSGACRVAVQPLDGQVIVAGLDGWGDYAVEEGCLHRIRFTGKSTPQLVAWKAWRNGIQLDFSAVIKLHGSADAWFAQQWNYIDSAKTYGSPEVSARDPNCIGHDRLQVANVVLLPDSRSIFVAIPNLHPAMCTQLRASLTCEQGEPVEIEFYATLQHLAADAPWAEATADDRATSLQVPTRAMNGDTNQRLVEHFDRLAGREVSQRLVAPDVQSMPSSVDFPWIRRYLLEPHCLMCHGAGTPHDFSTHAELLSYLRLDNPAASPVYGMVHTGSMPPYPLPSIPPLLKKALLEWIREGAPE
ncbi:MAG: hypothetical protein ACO3RV_02165 [Luteolibacter sp.]